MAPSLPDDLAEQIAQAVALKLGAAPPGPRATVGDLLDGWAATHRKLASFKCDFARAQRLIDWVPQDGQFSGMRIGDRDPMSLTVTDVDLWRSSREGMTTRLGKQPSPATINREVMMLVRLLNTGASRKRIPRNPLEGDEVFEDEDNAREVVIDEASFAKILERLAGHPIVRAFVILAYDSGMRMTEVLLCRWSWLDTVRGYVHIPGSVAKNGNARVADLSDRARAALEGLPRGLATDHIFINPERGALYDRRWLYELYRRAVEATDVRGPSGEMPVFHDLRRSWVTLARRRGIPESEIMAKSGHRDHSVFRRYSIVGDEDLRRSRERMEDGRRADLAELGTRIGPRRAPNSHAPAKIKQSRSFSR